MLRLVARNAANYLKALPPKTFQLQIVANAGAVTLFTNDKKDLYELVKPLMAEGVIFKLCANALAENSIPKENIWPGCEIVPAGLVEIVRLQRLGFAYIKP